MRSDWWQVWNRRSNATNIEWQEDPSCFERHLQRRYRNVLFSAKRQIVSLAELEEARAQDLLDATELRTRMLSPLQDAFPEPMATPRQVSDARDKIDKFALEAAQIGGAAGREIVLTLYRLWNALCDDLSADAADLPELLEATARLRISNDPLVLYRRLMFFAQMIRPDTPIRRDEIAISLALEHPETLEYVLDQTTDPILKQETMRRVAEAIMLSEQAGAPVSDADLKMDVLESKAEILRKAASQP